MQNDISSKKHGKHQRAFDVFGPLFAAQRIPACETNELEFGDMMFVGHGPKGPDTLSVGAERKTLSDLLACIRDSRFSGHQLPGLLATYDISWLIVEGAYRCNPHSGILQTWDYRTRTWTDYKLGASAFMHSELERFLFSLSIMTTYAMGKPLHIWRTRGPEDTVRAIADLYVLLTRKEWHEHRSHEGVQMPEIREPILFRKRTRAEEEELRRRRIAMCFSGIGHEKAKAVAQHFASPGLMMRATEAEWRAVDGIGRGIARGLVEEITYGETES